MRLKISVTCSMTLDTGETKRALQYILSNTDFRVKPYNKSGPRLPRIVI